ncbi:unannotated protein [freshwater metagenome]|uniref:Unannotated protein n=1 Tax=freshwater metagenome TaxID=449393 RepID=A0A6J7E2R4_9ZZZZ|nr:matrixin family metalloprotease [Actinomycetota bacterium]
MKRTGIGLVLVVALTALIFPGTSAAETLRVACLPPGGLVAAEVAQDVSPAGVEVTEFLADGAYRVSRCAVSGTLELSTTVALVTDPTGRRVRARVQRTTPASTTLYTYGDPADENWSAEWEASLPTVRAETPAPTEGTHFQSDPTQRRGSDSPGRQTPLASLAVADDSCTNGDYAFLGGAWSGSTYQYKVNVGSFPGGSDDRVAITEGHHNWDYTYNSCGYGDQDNFISDYTGSTSLGVHTVADGTSVIDRGNIGNVGCAGALACARLFPGSVSWYTEVDTRFSDAYSWSNAGASNAFDYEAVATHEAGHAIGLGHANSSEWLTMYYQACVGCLRWRTLARGDVLGMRNLYP